MGGDPLSGEDGGAPLAPANTPRKTTDLCDRCRIFLCSISRLTSCEEGCKGLGIQGLHDSRT